MDSIIVLMSTYNGEKYLVEQINSVLSQQGVEVSLLVRDDGSTDGTTEILNDYSQKGLLTWYSGMNLKPAKSFMDLVNKADTYEYYAFCDQDDIWLPEKLYNAIECLKESSNNLPVLYYGSTTLVDQNLVKMDMKQDRCVFTSFNNAIVSSNATGCTMVFNRKLRDILNMYKPDYQIMHDGWIHKVCLAVGGSVIYDDKSYILYRQHGNNVIGGSTNPIKRWKRRIDTIRKDPCPRSHGISELYNGYVNIMPENNKRLCELVIGYRSSIGRRIKLAKSKEIYSPNKRIDHLYRLSVLLGLF